ncbi:MAG: bifunctional [glutamine synthetase] adenylyltransferase/[glutamine synthetase]-adenylyl-L-tyrosine phosphorylase, partial [Mycobacteriales bacterium]
MTITGRASLARLGFADAGLAQRLLGDDGLALWDFTADAPRRPGDSDVIEGLAAAADPDLALRTLVRLMDAQGDAAALRTALGTSTALRSRLIRVLGASSALGDHLVSHPGEWRVLADDEIVAGRPDLDDLSHALLSAVGADPDADAPQARSVGADVVADLRLAYRRCLLVLAGRDLSGLADLPDVGAEMSNLAAATLSAALAIGRARLGADAVPCRLAVIGLGKCGGRELNYVSDVDVVFVAEPADPEALRTATALASQLIGICGEVAWPVDAGLRPEGRDGPLVRTLDSHVAYYERWATTWEFQALLKARPLAGDRALGE